jgi:hypothetical protein
VRNAPPPDEKGQWAENETASSWTPMVFPWTVSTCSEGIGSGGDHRAKRLLQKEEKVSNKDRLIAAKERRSREKSSARRGGATRKTGQTLDRSQQKNNCHKREVEK